MIDTAAFGHHLGEVNPEFPCTLLVTIYLDVLDRDVGFDITARLAPLLPGQVATVAIPFSFKAKGDGSDVDLFQDKMALLASALENGPLERYVHYLRATEF
jgi:hypothetical protein